MRNIKIRELKKDINNGYYELLDNVRIAKNVYITMLNEKNTLYINLLNLNDNVQGFTRIDSAEFMNMSKREFEIFINQIYYYCNEPIESDIYDY